MVLSRMTTFVLPKVLRRMRLSATRSLSSSTGMRTLPRWVPGVQVTAAVRPTSFREVTGDWSTELPSTTDFVSTHAEYRQLTPFCCADVSIELDAEGKRRKDCSWVEVKLPFSSDEFMRSQLSQPGRLKVRYGKLFEVIDSVAGDVAFRHARGLESVTLVTAAVDGMTAISDIGITEDLVIQAFLTYVGKSSLEIHVNLLQENSAQKVKLVGSTQLIFVARNQEGGAYEVPGLALSSVEEEAEFERGRIRAVARREKSKASLEVAPPRMDEVETVHQLHLRSRQMKSDKRKLMYDIKDGFLDQVGLLANFKYMSTTVRKSVNFMHSHNRNVHGNVFGGELMRLSYELAYVCAVCFLGQANTAFQAVDAINFIRPVHVGSIMEFTSTVTYSHGKDIVVLVTVEEINPQTDVRTKTNQLSYIFAGNDEASVPEVIPCNYEEYILYIMGRRTKAALD
jgi:acyl-coenzyme A thioesterase 9